MNIPNPNHGRFKSLLPFTFNEKTITFVAIPQNIFRPRGLALWAPERALIEPVLFHTRYQAVAGMGLIPARFFGMGKNFAQIAELINDGIEPPSWCDWQTLHVGQEVRLRVLNEFHGAIGPSDGVEVVMWGEDIL